MQRAGGPVFSLLTALVLASGMAAQTPRPAGNSPAIRAHFEKAQHALRSGDPDSAAAEFRAILALDPTNTEARANLGVMRFMAEDWAGAAGHFREALKTKPPSPKAQALLGMCEKRLGRPTEAQHLLEQAVPKMEDGKLRTQAGLDLVEILYAASDLGRAMEILGVLRRSDPRNVDLIYTEHRIYTDLANSALDTLALTAPESARMHQAMAQKLVNDGDIPGAVAQYRKALQLEPGLPGVHYELGQAILQGSTSDEAKDQAESEFKLALALDPADAGSEYWLGRIQALRLNYTEAMEHYGRAFKLRPNRPDLRLRMGEALLNLNEPQKALEHLQAAAHLDPLNAIAHYRLATLYRKLGNDTESIKELRDFKELRQAEERIQDVYQQMHRKNLERDVLPAETPAP